MTVTIASPDNESGQSEHEASAARAAAVSAATKELTKARKVLTESRDIAVRAVAVAEQTMLDAVTAVAAHNDKIKAIAADLVALGLRVEDETGVHDTGASTRGDLVRLSGEVWHSVVPQAMLTRSAAAVATAALGARRLVTPWGVPGDFVSRLPSLPAVPRPERHQPELAKLTYGVGVTESDREAARRNAPVYRTAQPGRGPSIGQ